ncbi:MAG: hypothetical protein M4D80_05150 [Myxococcota bacterium]|nr:hypothetical protein [Myxococcota bacterium]
MPATATDVDEPVRHHQRFEWKDEDEHNFREISQIDHRVQVRGGIRKAGVDHYDKQLAAGDRYATKALATRAYNEIITSLGYSHPIVETERDPQMSDYQPRTHPALEAECRAACDSPGPWSVYADWLLSEGDVIGEIASLAAAGQTGAATRKIREHMDVLVGNDDVLPAFEFRHGFVVGATLTITHSQGLDLTEITQQFLAAPLARFVESLRFGLAGYESDNDWGPIMRAIVDAPVAPHLRALRFDDYTRDDQEISWTAFGDLSFAWPHLPALELLHIRAGGGGTLGELVLPALRTFIFESGGTGQAELDSIAKARWPALEHLEVWFGSNNYGAAGTVSSLEAILENDLPNLAHLGVVNCQFIDDVIPALVGSTRLAQLHSLDLSKSVMHRLATDALVQNAKAFRHLASIDLSQNLLAPEHVEAIRAVLDNVIIDNQREYDVDEGDDEADFPRYVAVGE